MLRPMTEELLREILLALEREGVRYAIFGGIAVGAHGLSRATKDLDLFVAPDEGNVAALRRALEAAVGDPAVREITAADLEEYGLVRYGLPEHDFVIDLTARIGETFRHDEVETVPLVVAGVRVPVASARQLVRMKHGTGRPQDQADVARLRERYDAELD
jgi:hypothetical protein